MTIDSFNTLFYILAFVVPGFIFDSITRKLLPQGQHDTQSSFLRFLTASCVNYGLWSWLIFWLYQTKYYTSHPLRTGLIWLLLIFISPLIMGIIWGLLNKRRIIEKTLGKFGITTVNPVPTSWDYKFSKINEPVWVLVTLKDGSFIAGYWGYESFASSDGNIKDVYIEKVYKITSKGPWIPTSNNNDGILIATDQIKTIEFFSN